MEHRISPNEVVLAYSSSGKLSVKFGFNLYLPISGESVSVVTPALKEPPSTMKNPTGAEHPKFMATQTWEAVQYLLCCRHILSPIRKEGIPWRIKE